MSDNLSWAERTAKAIDTVATEAGNNGYVVNIYDMVLAAIEAAGELKTVKMKVALARCYECFKQQALEMGKDATITLPSDNFVDSLFELFK